MKELMNLTKALADETRVRMLMMLRGGELCVCQITELFGLAPSTVSKHLSILHQAGLVESRKTERWVYYRLPGREASTMVRGGFSWLTKAIEKDDQIKSDGRKLKEILKVSPAELCQRQCPK
ncbi:MAG TPA: metalloregulator ArsR/SmtB family transcription factor [Candidatus Sulfotelmatobacter sp.]|nr:metalloregulator ArsR/SmtB family transcription factor [Candidatus Sulfotelmatobacter sp.]